MTPFTSTIPTYTTTIRHEEDPNGYAGVRGTVETDIPIGSPIRLILVDPWGNVWTGVAGDKLESGRNGFGWIVSHAGDYTLTVKQRLQQQVFPIPIRGGEMTVVVLQPVTGDTPPAPPPTLTPPTLTQEQFDAILGKLDDVIAKLVEHQKDHAKEP